MIPLPVHNSQLTVKSKAPDYSPGLLVLVKQCVHYCALVLVLILIRFLVQLVLVALQLVLVACWCKDVTAFYQLKGIYVSIV